MCETDVQPGLKLHPNVSVQRRLTFNSHCLTVNKSRNAMKSKRASSSLRASLLCITQPEGRLEHRGSGAEGKWRVFVPWCEKKSHLSEGNERLMSPHVTLWLHHVNQSFSHNKGRNPQNTGLWVWTSVDYKAEAVVLITNLLLVVTGYTRNTCNDSTNHLQV